MQLTKETKEQWIIDQCRDNEAGMKTGNNKAAFDTLKLLTKSHQTRLTVIEEKNGNLLFEETAVIRRWTDYCVEL